MHPKSIKTETNAFPNSQNGNLYPHFCEFGKTLVSIFIDFAKCSKMETNVSEIDLNGK